MAGDVIGCCIDLDEGTVSYSRSVGLPSQKIAFNVHVVFVLISV